MCQKRKNDNYTLFKFWGLRFLVATVVQPLRVAVLMVALSVMVFSVLSVWIGFGRRVPDVRVVYVICTRSDSQITSWWTAFSSTTGRCVCSRDFSNVDVRLRPLSANVNRLLLRFVVFCYINRGFMFRCWPHANCEVCARMWSI